MQTRGLNNRACLLGSAATSFRPDHTAATLLAAVLDDAILEFQSPPETVSEICAPKLKSRLVGIKLDPYITYNQLLGWCLPYS